MYSYDFSVSVNYFWHHLTPDEVWYDQEDVYGNKDLLPAQTAQNAAFEIKKTLQSLPSQYAQFYKLRIMEILKSEVKSLESEN